VTAPFADRRAAGRALAEALKGYRGRSDVVVLALPRGGVPVAYEVARALHAPLDVFTVRKLGVPGHRELAMGAVATGGSVVLDRDLIQRLQVPADELEAVIDDESRELLRREAAYRDHRRRPSLGGTVAIVVDDGLATGASMQAAIEALRTRHPARIVAAAPVGAGATCERLRSIADQVVCPLQPEPFFAVGMYYEDFGQTTDDEVRALLNQAERERRTWQVA